MKLIDIKDIAMISANFTYAISLMVECYIKITSSKKINHPHKHEGGRKK